MANKSMPRGYFVLPKIAATVLLMSKSRDDVSEAFQNTFAQSHPESNLYVYIIVALWHINMARYLGVQKVTLVCV